MSVSRFFFLGETVSLNGWTVRALQSSMRRCDTRVGDGSVVRLWIRAGSCRDGQIILVSQEIGNEERG